MDEGARPDWESITDNTLRMCYDLDEAMFEAYRRGDNELAESTARALLFIADLPLLLRARSCMILGCSVEPDFLDMAKEAVRIARIGVGMWDNPYEDQLQWLRDCETVLREAQEDWDAAEEESEEDEDDDGETEEVEEDIEGEEDDEETSTSRTDATASQDATNNDGHSAED